MDGLKKKAARALEQHLAPAEIAKRLGVGERVVWQWVARGRETLGREGIWPVFKLGHRIVRVPESAVARFVEGRLGLGGSKA